MSTFPSLGSVVTAVESGLPAVLTSELLKQISGLIYVKTSIGGYFFDAVFKTDHSTHLNVTSHPVQNGANISDHCFMEPARVSMEIGMSDVNSTSIFGQFATGSSKSQSAFDALRKMQSNRQPVTVVTRLSTYDNMMIEDLTVPDDNKTYNGLRAVVAMKQIIMVDVAEIAKVSARPQTTNSTNVGAVQTVNPKETTAYKIEQAIKGKK